MTLQIRQSSLLNRAITLLGPVFMVASIMALAVHAGLYLSYGAKAIAFPYGLDYGEGIVWQQALLIPGARMYGDITHYPFIVFHYTPIYHLVVRAVASTGADILAAGRSVSIVSTLVISTLLGAITFRAMRGSVSATACFVGGAVSGLMAFTYQPLQTWSVFMRVDMLAIAFSAVGIYLALLAGRRTVVLCAAVLMFVLAVYTKQTEVAAPIAALAVAAIIDLRSAIKASAFGVLVGGAALVVLELYTHGGFLRHTFGYNLNPFTLRRFAEAIRWQRPDALAVFASVVALVVLWRIEASRIKTWSPQAVAGAMRDSARLRALATVSLWLLLSTASLIAAGKIGSSVNYFIEWLCVSALPIGMCASMLWDGWTGSSQHSLRPSYLLSLLLPIVLIFQALHLPVPQDDRVDDPKATVAREELVDLIRTSQKPVLTEDMTLTMRAGKEVPLEPAIFRDLAAMGAWDQGPFIRMIQDDVFAFVVISTQEHLFSPEAFQAIDSSYPIKREDADYLVRFPAAQASPSK